MDPSHLDPDDRNRIHVTLTTKARRALRICAAARGITVANLITHWAMADAHGLGLDIVRLSERLPHGR